MVFRVLDLFAWRFIGVSFLLGHLVQFLDALLNSVYTTAYRQRDSMALPNKDGFRVISELVFCMDMIGEVNKG
jgi:hypothetical protein